ncbi:secretory lipase [Grosmannia clavigera kw1407]|uniref:Secretory lipase n=1 Tax=Grosmannia clavigera (strain kw1407 / UAMH 11150) TaxID=655863 RepID=F0XEE9_GROCL|nr:secretory lipase [Grosmannia clavigera kw1407]EFX03523.1 secretory lipase [Grosmannia clavigera kw1407]
MVTLHALLTVLMLSTLSQAIPLIRRSTVLPSNDAFYHVPDNITSYSPRAIINYRKPPAPIAAFAKYPINLQNSWQILYRTTDSLNNATATVLTVLVPYNADFSKVLSYQIAEDAASPNLPLPRKLRPSAALEQHWVLIVPDHEGPAAAYLANHLAGYSTLDGIRAGLSSGNITGMKSDATVAMWGYSGGSLASGWAAELQPLYAPELKIAGAAIGGTVPNISNVISSVDGSTSAGLVPTGVMGLANQYPLVKAIVEQHVLPQYLDAFANTTKQCLEEDLSDFSDKNVSSMLDSPDLFTNTAMMNVFSANALGSNIPQIPLYIYKAVQDELSPIADTDKMYGQYCAGGAIVKYERDLVFNHGTLSAVGAPKALTWLIQVFDGTATQKSCTKETIISSLLDPVVLGVLPEFIFEDLLDLLGKEVGTSL